MANNKDDLSLILKRKKKAEKRMAKRLKNVQRHHITYNPEWIVPIFKGEHWLVSQMQRRKYVSKGFLIAVQYELDRMRKSKIYDLERIKKNENHGNKAKKK